jgi:glycosyltransferase involved in cell wall biosynthesis
MRVLILVDSLRAGGKERQLVSFATALRRRPEIQLVLVSMGTDRFFERALLDAGVTPAYLVRNCRWDPLVFLRLRKLVRSFRPDVIHTTCWMTTFYGLPVARLAGAKVVNGSIRNAFRNPSFRWRIERWLLRCSDARIANSEAGLVSRGFQPGDRGNSVVHNGFDFERLAPGTPSDSRTLAITSNEDITVGMVAQFKDDKDHETYIRAASLVRGRRRDVRFVAVGDGKNFETCRRLSESLSHPVTFLGKHEHVEDLVRSWKIGVLATFTEGISNSIMEYMALEKPVVATDGGGTREILADTVTGFLVPPQRPDLLQERIEYLLDHPGEAAAMGAAGRRRLQERFSLDAMVDQTLAVYAATLGPDPVMRRPAT